MAAPRRQNICRGCGKTLTRGLDHCSQCAVGLASERLVDVARLGRTVAHTPEARTKAGQKQRQHAVARNSWNRSSNPTWLTASVYSETTQPLLAKLPNSVIASRIGVSRWYAGRIRQGYRPHPRHWEKLANAVGFQPDEKTGRII